MDTSIIISFIISSILLTLSPGPDIIYVLTQSIGNGKQSGIALAAGLVTGIIGHTLVVAFGLGTIINNSPTIFYSIKYLGAAYLLYLAYKIYKHKNIPIKTSTSVTKKKLSNLYKEGIVMNLLNPKVTIFFLAFFPGFLFHNKWPVELQFICLGTLFMIQAFLVFYGISTLSAMVSHTIHKSTDFQKYMPWAQIIVLVGIAIFLLL